MSGTDVWELLRRNGEQDTPFTVDVHAHAVFPEVFALIGDDPAAIAHQQREAESFGAESTEINLHVIQQIGRRLTDLDARLQAMDEMSVDVQVVSPSPVHYHEWAEREGAAQLAAAVNDGIARLVGAAPHRLLGLGVVPLRYPMDAVRELRRAVSDLGLVGVEISTNAAEIELGDPELEEFWCAAEALGAIVFIHPWGCSLGTRLDQYYLANTVGQPVETAVALSHLIFSGTLDRHPDLTIIAAHGGGYLPTYIGRSDHAWRVRPDARRCAAPPSEYLHRLYFDSLVYDPEALRHLVGKVGSDQVLLGSDYPFDMGVTDPVVRLAAAELPARAVAQIRGETISELLMRATPAVRTHRNRKAPAK